MDTEYFQLKNGMRIISHQDSTSPLIHLALDFNVGSSVDTISGIAHLCEHLMFTGTKRFPDFDQALLEHGASNNAWTGYDHSNFHCSAPPESLLALLEVEADRLEYLSESLTKEKVEIEKSIVHNEMNESMHEDPYNVLILSEYKALFGASHPYGHPIIGLHDDLLSIDLDSARAFLQQWYHPSNATLLIAGNFDKNRLTEGLVQHIAPLPPKQRYELQVKGRRNKPYALELNSKADTNYGYLGLDWILPPISSPVLVAANILSDILSAPQYGLLYRDIELNLKWATELEADLYAMKLASVFSITAILYDESLRSNVVERVLYHLKRIESGLIDPLLLKKSKKKFKLHWMMQKEEIEERVERYQEWLRQHSSLIGFQQYTENFQAVTTQDLQMLASHLLSSPHLTLNGIPNPQ